MDRRVVIAIDGTAASGKSTNARIVAEALGFLHVDTGAMYRTGEWYILRSKASLLRSFFQIQTCQFEG